MPRALILTAVVALAIVAVLGGGFVSAVSGVGAPLSAAGTHSTHLASDATPVGTALLKGAVASVNAASARLGSTSKCAVISGTAAACGGSSPRTLSKLDAFPHANPSEASETSARAASTSHSPTPATPDPSWYNVTTQLTTASGGVIPAIGPGSGMAFDPLLGEVVVFAGTGVTADGPYENVTWTYNGITWTDLSSTLHTAPSIRWYPGFDYDPAMGGVILVGGLSAANLGLNDTWLFTGTWKNISATTGILRDAANGGGQKGSPLGEGGIGGSAAAWDPLLHGFLLTDGCDDSSCGQAYALSWLLNSTGWWTISYGPGWGLANPVPDYNLTWLGYTGMAWDPVDGYMVLFGGLDYFSDLPQNYTYTYTTGVYTGSTVLGAHWDNLTGTDLCSPACGAPAGRDGASITWDAQLGGVFMTGGYNATLNGGGGGEYNDTWEFVGGHWHTLTPPPAAFYPVYGSAIAVNSTQIGVFMVGGFRAGAPGPDYGSQDEWVFETPPQATLAVAPPAVDLGTATTFTAGWTVGTGSGIEATWNVSYGDGHFASVARGATTNTSVAFSHAFPAHTYASAATFKANVTWTDFFYINGTASVSVPVNPDVAATITASKLTVTAGNAVTFTTSPTGGSGTYTYAWSFGDGTTSAVQDPAAHTFAKVGSYVVNLTVTDSLGQVFKATSVTITVNAAPASFNLGSTGTYLVIGLVVLIVVVLAVVLLMRRGKKPAPAAQPWQAGTPPAGAGAPPPGAGGVPPGVGGSPPPPPAP